MLSQAIVRPLFFILLSTCAILLYLASSAYLFNRYNFCLSESETSTQTQTTMYIISRKETFKTGTVHAIDQGDMPSIDKPEDQLKSDPNAKQFKAFERPHKGTIEFDQKPKARLKMCPKNPPNLVGPIEVQLDAESMESMATQLPSLSFGGHFKPENCKARQRVAIIIPFRDRSVHLQIFLKNMHSVLQRQLIEYRIFVIEQVKKQTFNRGKLMNVGYREASKLYDWDCFIFHDVDLLPEDDRNLYLCSSDHPIHLSFAIDKFNYNLLYSDLFGGATALTKKMIKQINGFSNDYWGWGGEDDDVFKRLSANGYEISRNPKEIARYKMIKHERESDNAVNGCRFNLLEQTNNRWKKDGLSNLNYKVVNISFNRLFTNIKVDLLKDLSIKVLRKENLGC